MIYIFLHWSVNILPNQLLRATSIFTVRSDRFKDRDDRTLMKSDALPEIAQVGERGAAEARDEGEEVKTEDEEDSDASPPIDRGTAHADNPGREIPAIVDVEAPWTRNTTDLDRTIREMEAIRDVVRKRSGFLAGGAVPAFPRLDVWIAGLLAMKSSRSGENVPSFVSTEIEAAAERLEAHQRLLAFIVWAIPTLGFIGTVVGIGTALLATVDLQSGDIIARLQAESRVAVEIGVAFDTTLVALALSFVLMLALHFLQHLEESMLSEEKHDALRALVQIENILPDDPIRELREGLAQLGLTAAQIERWSDILAGQAPKFREVMDNAERDISEWSRQSKLRGRSSRIGVLPIGGLLILVVVLVLYTMYPRIFGL
jgi:biopolymer transport protein ExbB/TolQ